MVVGDSLPLVAIAAEGRESENMHVSDCGNENTGSYILTMQSTLSYISILHVCHVAHCHNQKAFICMCIACH